MNEHDKLFKEIESVKENAADLIEGTFPAEILEQLDLTSLKLDNNSYIDENLSEYFSDLIYNCNSARNEKLKITILFEHKSYKPKIEYLQLLRYMTNIWTHEQENKKKLSLIIPIIIYHGSAKWEVKKFSEYFKDYSEDLFQFIPIFQYLLTDIVRYKDEVIKKQIFKREFNRALALLFKYSSKKELLKEKLFDIFKELASFFEDENDQKRLIPYLVYVFEISEIDTEEFRNILTEISRDGGNKVVSTAMKLRKEGFEEGIAKGENIGAEKERAKFEKERAQTVKKMLMKGMSLEDIMDLTELSLEEIEKYRKM